MATALKLIPYRGNARLVHIFPTSGDLRRSQGQTGCVASGAWRVSLHWPLTFEVTFGGLPCPSDTTFVVRVQVWPLLLTDTIVVLVCPAGRLP